MTANDLKNLHPDDVRLWLFVEKAVWRLAIAAKLEKRLRTVEPVPRGIISTKNEYLYGRCYSPPENKLQFTLRLTDDRGRWSANRIPKASLIDTIAHEMAHLDVGNRELAHHGPRFFRTFGRMLVLQEKIKIRFDIAASGAKLPA